GGRPGSIRGARALVARAGRRCWSASIACDRTHDATQRSPSDLAGPTVQVHAPRLASVRDPRPWIRGTRRSDGRLARRLPKFHPFRIILNGMNSTDKLVDSFEAGEIDTSDFPHERHVRVAWGLAQRYEPDDAFRRLVAGIRGIAARAGRPDAYHETITRAWFELIASAEQLDRSPELFDKSLLRRYYSPERLAAGRERWLEPDLHPLGLPPPDSKPEQADVRAALRRIPTGVAVLAARGNGTVHATTVSSITSVSREPALVSVCLANDSRAFGLVHDAK